MKETRIDEIFGVDANAVRSIIATYSEGKSQNAQLNILREIREVANETFDDNRAFCQYDQFEWKEIFAELDNKEACLKWKTRYITAVKKIFGYYIWAKNSVFHDNATLLLASMPGVGLYCPIKMNETGQSRDKKAFDKDTVLLILGNLREINFERYIELAGLFFTAARSGAWSNVTKDSINMSECTLSITTKKTAYHKTGKFKIFLPEPFLWELMLFFDEHEKVSIVSQEKFRQHFHKIFGTEYWPHNARYTTASLWKGIDESLRKRFLGHAITDITDKYYTSIYENYWALSVLFHVHFPYKEMFLGYDWDKWESIYLTHPLFEEIRNPKSKK